MKKGIRSTRKEVKEAIRQHIKECVYDENENEYPSFKKAALHLAAEFNRVANYPNNIRRIPSTQERFKDYMQGIPFHFEFEYYRQKEVVSGWLQSDPDLFTDQEAAEKYYYLIYREIKNFIK